MAITSLKKPNGIDLNQSKERYWEDLCLGRQIYSSHKMVACFGGSSIRENNTYKQAATQLAELLAMEGISLVTGGGKGIMSAVNEGAYRVNPEKSYGLRVRDIVKKCNASSEWIRENNLIDFNTLSVRLLTLIGASDAIVFFPGGFGTLEETFSLLVRVRLGLMERMPIYFYGSKFWTGLKSWMASEVVEVGALEQEALELFNIEDDINSIAQQIIERLG